MQRVCIVNLKTQCWNALQAPLKKGWGFLGLGLHAGCGMQMWGGPTNPWSVSLAVLQGALVVPWDCSALTVRSCTQRSCSVFQPVWAARSKIESRCKKPLETLLLITVISSPQQRLNSWMDLFSYVNTFSINTYFVEETKKYLWGLVCLAAGWWKPTCVQAGGDTGQLWTGPSEDDIS